MNEHVPTRIDTLQLEAKLKAYFISKEIPLDRGNVGYTLVKLTPTEHTELMKAKGFSDQEQIEIEKMRS